MKTNLVHLGLSLTALFLAAGCATEIGGHPYGTVPYSVVIETSEPGSRIELDGDYLGKSPLTATIWGDKDGTFHGSGDGHTVFVAYPVRSGQYVQKKSFLNGAQAFMFGQEDRIPTHLYFDLNQKPESLQISVPK